MGFVSKVHRAVSLWLYPSVRRANVLAECVFWGIGIAMIGVVFTVLAATGTFPVPLNIAIAQGLLGIYISKYALYAISGVCAYFVAKSARQQLRQGQPTTTAKALLAAGAACVVASAALTVAGLVIAATGGSHIHQTPAWVYVIQALILLLRLMFLSVLIMALYTLFETDRHPEYADIVAAPPAGPNTLPVSKAPTHYPPPAVVSSHAFHPAAAAYAPPPPAATTPTQWMAMQPQSGAQLHTNTTPTAAYPPQPHLPGNSNNHPAATASAAPLPAGFVPAHVAGGGHFVPVAAPGVAGGGHFVPVAAPGVAGGVQFVPVAAPGVAGGVQFVPVAAAAPPVAMRGHRHHQGPSSLLSGLVAFRMGQRAAHRNMRRMGRR